MEPESKMKPPHHMPLKLGVKVTLILKVGVKNKKWLNFPNCLSQPVDAWLWVSWFNKYFFSHNLVPEAVLDVAGMSKN